jgi:ABC-type lipoprotein release transport system permease subunit
MTFWTLLKRSLRFHIRAHFGVCLGAVIGSTALVGALVVGDSVRESLRQQALSRVGNTWFALAPVDRLFTSGLATNRDATGKSSSIADYALTATLLASPGTASRPGGEARANQVQIFGVVEGWNFLNLPKTNLSSGTVLLNKTLAAQLDAKEGDQVLLRTSQREQLSEDSPIAPRDQQGIALTLKVAGICEAESGGDLNLRSSGVPPMNAFVRAEELWSVPGLKGKANLLLVGQTNQSKPGWTEEALTFLNAALQQSWTLEDTGLKLD